MPSGGRETKPRPVRHRKFVAWLATLPVGSGKSGNGGEEFSVVSFCRRGHTEDVRPVDRVAVDAVSPWRGRCP